MPNGPEGMHIEAVLQAVAHARTVTFTDHAILQPLRSEVMLGRQAPALAVRLSADWLLGHKVERLLPGSRTINVRTKVSSVPVHIKE